MSKRYLVVGTTTESVILTADDSDTAILIFGDTFKDVEFSRFEVTELKEGDRIK